MLNWAIKPLCVAIAACLIQLLVPAVSANVDETYGLNADKLVVRKAERRLYVYKNGTVIATYPIALGGNPVGPKVFVGDSRTPEGRYVIEGRNPNSDFYRSLKISYPSEKNRALAEQYGISPGGHIMIHGEPNRKKPDFDINSDWTDGCIAVTNREMDELWRTVKIGTPIIIMP